MSKFLDAMEKLIVAEAEKAGVAIYIETDSRSKLPKLTIWERVNFNPEKAERAKPIKKLPSGTKERKIKPNVR